MKIPSPPSTKEEALPPVPTEAQVRRYFHEIYRQNMNDDGEVELAPMMVYPNVEVR